MLLGPSRSSRKAVRPRVNANSNSVARPREPVGDPAFWPSAWRVVTLETNCDELSHMTAEASLGPSGYENWRAMLSGSQQPYSAFEVQLYSDAYITNEVREGAGPYVFYNAVPAGEIGRFTHVVTMRVEQYLAPSSGLPDMTRTDFTRYHGGWLADELAALVGLSIGIRLRAGGISREFRADEVSGHPRADTARPVSPLPHVHREWVIPRANGRHDVRKAVLPRLSTYPLLPVAKAISLVRAARLYQDAMWVAESQPQLAWLLFVSAVEVVATEHQLSASDAVDVLRHTLPDLCTDLQRAGGDDLVSKCAEHLSRQLRATARFLEFFSRFMPSEPERPADQVVTVPWTWSAMKKALSQVYNYRSLALHDGTPFPAPMCHGPGLGGLHWERPSGLAASTHGAAWMAKDLPLLLHVFEHLTRGAILGWWDECAAQMTSAIGLQVE